MPPFYMISFKTVSCSNFFVSSTQNINSWLLLFPLRYPQNICFLIVLTFLSIFLFFIKKYFHLKKKKFSIFRWSFSFYFCFVSFLDSFTSFPFVDSMDFLNFSILLNITSIYCNLALYINKPDNTSIKNANMKHLFCIIYIYKHKQFEFLISRQFFKRADK